MVGTINTFACDRRSDTFRYSLAIRSAYRRRGYASGAIRLVLRYYFQELGYQKVNAEVYTFKGPSVELYRRLGFREEGRLRRVVYTNGRIMTASSSG